VTTNNYAVESEFNKLLLLPVINGTSSWQILAEKSVESPDEGSRPDDPIGHNRIEKIQLSSSSRPKVERGSISRFRSFVSTIETKHDK
jgi:hypothetical protein